MTNRISCSLFFLLLATTLQAQRPDSVTRYIDSALQLFQSRSLYADRVDWLKVGDSVRYFTRQAQTYKQADAAIFWAFAQLKDKHGLVATADSFYRYTDGQQRVFSEGIKAAYQKPRAVAIALLDQQVGYYRMPALLIGSNTAKMKEWANRLSDSLCKLLTAGPRTLIIDLRMNNGGNSAPMFEVMKPFLGKRSVVYEADRHFKIRKAGSDSATFAYQAHAIPSQPCQPGNPTMRIAVLIGPGTASSGEILAMAFAARPYTRLFGEESIGLCNVTNGLHLSTNSFYCLLTESYVADYKKKINKRQKVVPDVFVSSEKDNFTSPSDDPTVQAAIRWLTK